MTGVQTCALPISRKVKKQTLRAFKVFNPDWTCKGFQYEIGKTYKIEGEPSMCESGFHACKKVSDCFSYYSFDPKNKVAEVELSGVTCISYSFKTAEHITSDSCRNYYLTCFSYKSNHPYFHPSCSAVYFLH